MKTPSLKFIKSLVLLVLVSVLFASVGQTLGLVENPHQVALRFGAVVFAIGFIGGIAGASRASNMAFADGFVISDTTYAGEAASQFIVKAITGADTIQGGHCYVKDGIKKLYTIPRWDSDYNTLIQDRAATPISQGSFAVDGKVLDVEDYMLYTEFNPRDFEDHWFATQQNATLIDRALPYSAESVVVQEVLKRHAKYFNKLIWNGNKALATNMKYIDGWVTKTLASAGYISVGSGNYAPLTAVNIVAKLLLGYNLLPDALKYDTSMKIFMNYATFNLFDQAQKDQLYKGVDFTQIANDKFYGRQVVKIADMPDNCFFYAKGSATMDSNLWVGMNSVQDAQLKLSPLQANSELWFIKMLCKADVQVGWNEETVLYHPNMKA
jgi:hypothetical protein